MAEKKRKIIDDPFASTTPGSGQAGRFDLDQAPTVATGLGIRKGELNAIETISGELGVTKNKFMRWCLRYVIQEYEAGRLDLKKWLEVPPEPKNDLRMP